jgi:hypothetical protein
MDVLGNGLGVYEVVSTGGVGFGFAFLHTFHGNRDRGGLGALLLRMQLWHILLEG